MSTVVTGLTAARMLEIEAESIVDGNIVGGNLILIKHDGTEINAGPVGGPAGPAGPAGPPGQSGIPGEVKLWPDDTLPEEVTYGKWVWADGAYYPVATYPIAASHIAAAWRTFDGASDPGPSNFRVPDLRGLVPSGADAMPGGARANRMTRAAAAVLAGKSGKELHALQLNETPRHSHRSDGAAGAGGVVDTGGVDHTHSGVTNGRNAAHKHGMSQQRFTMQAGTQGAFNIVVNIVGPGGVYNNGLDMDTESADHQHAFGTSGASAYLHQHGISTAGGDATHENVQPTVFVPYIVFLGG